VVCYRLLDKRGAAEDLLKRRLKVSTPAGRGEAHVCAIMLVREQIIVIKQDLHRGTQGASGMGLH